MKRILFIITIAALALLVLTAPARAQEVKDISEFKTQSHVILIAQDNDTEVTMIVDGKNRGEMLLQSGVNYLGFPTDGKPDVTVIAYGDRHELTMTEGRGTDWYTFLRLAPPKDGDGDVE